jgi:hypothetical protein
VTRRGFLANPLIVVGIGVEVALIVLITYTGPGQAIFGTAPLRGEAWLLAIPFAGLMLAAEEARKWLVRRLPGRGKNTATDKVA